jgi:hypothetical protein
MQILNDSSYGFASPEGIAFDGSHMWITNRDSNSITEVNSGDGTLARTFTTGNYGLDGPTTAIFDGRHLWVVNFGGNSVTAIQI